ncbi:hypothetical protein [Bacillus pseudomycoides]|uniref:hypothetical protein n=1 Tax=Bacillus pseudomycoides TaxID=64104 RepID=UPI000BF10E92|nr:hypothetical protein [Bacillus pseudomycoides]PEM69330.1 hypothetical protein CN619_21585 [Bacillus pseudomycoides]
MENHELISAFSKAREECRKRINKAVMIGEKEIEFEMIRRMIERAEMSDERIVIITDIPIFDIQRVRQSIIDNQLVHVNHNGESINTWDAITEIVKIEKEEIIENMIVRMITKLGLSNDIIKVVTVKSDEVIEKVREIINTGKIEDVKESRRKYLRDFTSRLTYSFADGFVGARRETVLKMLEVNYIDDVQIALTTDFTVEEIKMIREEKETN